MPPIYLRNGYRIHSESATSIWMGFREVMEADPGALYELVAVCRDENHVIHPNPAPVFDLNHFYVG